MRRKKSGRVVLLNFVRCLKQHRNEVGPPANIGSFTPTFCQSDNILPMWENFAKWKIFCTVRKHSNSRTFWKIKNILTIRKAKFPISEHFSNPESNLSTWYWYTNMRKFGQSENILPIRKYFGNPAQAISILLWTVSCTTSVKYNPGLEILKDATLRLQSTTSVQRDAT